MKTFKCPRKDCINKGSPIAEVAGVVINPETGAMICSDCFKRSITPKT